MATEFSTEGCNYGECTIKDKQLHLRSMTSDKTILGVSCEGISQCVVPQANRDELEIQFLDTGKADRHEDKLVQITLHFPSVDEDAEHTRAEDVQNEIMAMGVLTSLTGDILAEFTKDMGTFVTPRGKYALQMTSSYVHMQGPQYSYKIRYEDINSLYLLPKADGARMAFVIALEKPIRQGNQKYLNLVIDTHKLEHTMRINMSEQEIADKYNGELSPEMTMPLSSLIAKTFKVIAGKKVFVPKQFVSTRDAHCIGCTLKTAEGTLFPLAKSFIFIHKPTVILPFDTIEHVEFQRYEPAATFATRNFDMVVTLRNPAPGEPKEYPFNLIERAEYASLFDYCKVKEIKIKNPVEAGVASRPAGLDLGEDDADEDEDEEDDDYDAGAGSDSSSAGEDSDDSDGSGADMASDASGDMAIAGKKRASSSKAGGNADKKRKKEKKEKVRATGKKGKAKRAKKDKNAPKGALSAYFMFSADVRPSIVAEGGSLSVTEIAKEIGRRWKEISAEERAPYEARAAEDKRRYAAEMKAYKQGRETDSGGGGGGGDESDASR